MPNPKNRNAFVRTKVGPVEKTISLGILCLLAGIGVAVWQKGKHFDPNLYSLRSDALKSTALQAKAETLPAETPEKSVGKSAESAHPAEGEEGSTSAPASPAATGEPMEILLSGLKPMGKTEFYSPDTLYEKIDGRSPAYLEFNCQALRTRSFAIGGSKASYVDVYEFRMDTPINAFGIFSQERDPSGKPVGFAPDGYAGEMGFFFRQGAVYFQVIASDQNPKTMELAKQIAENRAQSIPADNAGLDARKRLPNVGLIPQSISFIQENAQGQAFLKNVFQASYDFEGEKTSFFLMVTDPKTAAEARQAYLGFCGRFGKTSELPESNGAKLFQAESFGSTKVIYQREGEIGGVFDSKDAERARRFVESYLQGKL